MIRYTTGDLFDAQTEAIVNTVNTVGVMGKGIALQFKKRFPENYSAYRKACKENKLKPGKLLVTESNTLFFRYIINFPTKTDWKKPSKYEYLEVGLEELVRVIRDKNIKSIAIPPLGAGNGKLEWDKVRNIISTYLAPLENVEIVVFEPQLQFVERDNKKTTHANITPIRSMLLKAFEHYDNVDNSLNLLVTQKLSYFLQRLGEPLKLRFEKGHYGPYAANLNKVLQAMNGTFIAYKSQFDNPSTTIKILPYRKDEVNHEFDKLSKIQRTNYQELIRFMEGFETPFSLELLATVDWILQKKPNITPENIHLEIEKWTERKSELIKKHHVKVAYKHLMLYRDKFYTQDLFDNIQ